MTVLFSVTVLETNLVEAEAGTKCRMSRPLLALSASVVALTLATGLGHSSSGAESPGNAEGITVAKSYLQSLYHNWV